MTRGNDHRSKAHRLISLVLALALAVTMLPTGLITARAEEAEGVRLYFKLPEGSTASGWCANVWGDRVTTTGDSENAFRPSSWGTGDKFPALIADEGSTFGYVTVTGAVEGMEFVNAEGTECKCWNPQITNLGLPSAYYDPAAKQWYKDSACTEEVTSFLMLGTDLGGNWSPTLADNASNTFVSHDGEIFTKTYKNLQPKKYSFKILQDPDKNDGWNHQVEWGAGSLDRDGDNSAITLTAPADVTFKLNASDDRKKVTVTTKYAESFVYTDKQPSEIQAGKTVELSKTASYYDGNGNSKTVDVNYSLPEGTENASISDNTLTVDKSYDSDKITVTASYGEYHTTFDISVVQKQYNVTINYYNPDWSDFSHSDIWLWENGGSGNSDQVQFTDTVEDTDNGITWQSGKVTLSFNHLGMKARKDNTSGGDGWGAGSDSGDRIFTIPEDETDVTLWYVNGQNPVAEKPVITTHAARYIDFTYTNTEAEHPFFYSWQIGDDTHQPLAKQTDGTWHIRVKVPYGVESVEFVLGLDDTDPSNWIKEGGNHTISIPADQTLVYYTIAKGGEPELAIPFNKGYEIDPDNGKVHFYYRDETALENGTLSGENVSLELKAGTTLPMTYNVKNKRFEAETALTNGITAYRYVVNGEKELDTYNTLMTSDNEYSYFEYYKPEVTLTATLDKGTINYNTNDVVRIDLKQNKSSDADPDIEIKSATVDATSLGAGIRNIDLDNKAVTIACTEDIKPGTYDLPVQIIDQYGNIYKNTVKEKVTQRPKASSNDFDWDEANIYFMVTDRFFDGDSTNNTANDQYLTAADKAKGTTTYGTNEGLYHGGDFKGIEDKLDYLKDLGINTIWITPIVENIPGVEVTGKGKEDVPYNASYHGYWASDFTKLNPALGTDADFRNMIDAAHSKGIKIMVDVVLNHSGYGTQDKFSDMLRTTDEGGDQKSSQSGLPDFRTEDKAVRDQLVEWQTNWVKNFGIDYFRVDTVKHVDIATWQELKNSLTDVNPSFKMIGEYFGAGASSNGGTLGTGAMDSDLDFDFNDWATQFVRGGITAVENNLTSRNGKLNNTYMTGQFLGSHDEDGFVYNLENNGMTASAAQAAGLVAASLQLTAKGQPVIYYGEEIGQTGANNYPYQTNRYDFDWTKVNANNKTYAHYKKMLAIRNQYLDVYAHGTRTTVEANDAKGYDIFTRSYNGTTLYNILNIKSEAQSIALTGLGRNTVYTDLYTGQVYTTDGSGSLTAAVPSAEDGGTAILVKTASGAVTPGASGNSGNAGNTGAGTGSTTGTTSGTTPSPSLEPTPSPSPVPNPTPDPTPVASAQTTRDKTTRLTVVINATTDASGIYRSPDGTVLTNSAIKTPSGIVLTDKTGKATKPNSKKKYNGKTYLINKHGTIAAFKEKVTVKGKTYVTKKDGTPYKKKFVTLKTGSRVRCSKDGTIIKNRAFKVGKHTYVATRTGALKKNGRITIGHRRYTVKNYIVR